VPSSDTAYTPSRPSVSSGDTYTSATTVTTDCDLPLTPPRVRFMDSIRSLNRSSGKGFSTSPGIASSSSVSFQDRFDLSSIGTCSLPGSDIASCSTADVDVDTVRLPLVKRMSRLAISNVGYDEDGDLHDIPPKPINQPDPPRAQVVYSSGGTRVNFTSLSSRQKKKRKLIVSGVGHKDFRKFEGVKRWCEVTLTIICCVGL
jgi:hypothetical protein